MPDTPKGRWCKEVTSQHILFKLPYEQRKVYCISFLINLISICIAPDKMKRIPNKELVLDGVFAHTLGQPVPEYPSTHEGPVETKSC